MFNCQVPLGSFCLGRFPRLSSFLMTFTVWRITSPLHLQTVPQLGFVWYFPHDETGVMGFGEKKPQRLSASCNTQGKVYPPDITLMLMWIAWPRWCLSAFSTSPFLHCTAWTEVTNLQSILTEGEFGSSSSFHFSVLLYFLAQYGASGSSCVLPAPVLG